MGAYDIHRHDSGLYTAEGQIFASGAQTKASGDDPFGASKPSPIPSPTRSSGEPIPKPGLPEKYPDYLKPIPVNTRNIEHQLRGYLNREKPKLARILYSTWTAQEEAVKFQEIRNAMRDGQFSQKKLQAFRQSYAEMINKKMAPKWRAAIEAGAKNMGDQVATQIGKVPAFNAKSEMIDQWVKKRAGELAVNFSKAQYRALNSTIRHFTVRQPIGANSLDRIIRAQIGLTPRQSKAVENFTDQLLEDSDLTRKQVTHRARNYADRLWRQRGLRIARTELAFAYNHGTFSQMRQVAANEWSGDPIVKKWRTADYEKVCDFCGPLDGQTVDIEQTFPGATERLPNTFTPPGHPNCRCTLVYVRLTSPL